MQSINLLISSILQIILFSIVPFIWWLLRAKKQTNFLEWMGIKKPVIENRKKYIASFTVTVVFFMMMLFITPYLVRDQDIATSQFIGQGFKALVPAMIYSFLQTGLSEEIFFRGFLTKRLSNKFGFRVGNTIQGLLFGLLHGFMFIPLIGCLKGTTIVILTGIIGILLGWINEKQSAGSIMSSWLLHGIANITASIVAIFSLI